MGVSENGKSSHKENDSGCLNVTAAAAREREGGRERGRNRKRVRERMCSKYFLAIFF